MSVDSLKEKLIIIVLGTLKGMGGAERQAILLAENFKKKGLLVKIVAFTGGNAEALLKQKNIDYHIYHFNGYQPLKKNIIPLIRLIFFLRKLGPYAFIPFITLNSKYIGLIWRFTGAKFACWNQRDEGREIYGSRLEKISANNVPIIISNSFAGRDAIVDKIGIVKSKIKVINNGIEIPNAGDKRINWHTELKLDEKSILVTMLASIYKFKDHTTLLKAWEIVMKEFEHSINNPVLILAGAFKGMENQLKVLCFDLKIAQSVHFIGVTPFTNSLIEASELVVHSSNKEGCPNAVLEAMALAKPVVATNISGNLQALGTTHEELCLNFQNDHIDLAAKILCILRNKILGNEIGAYNQKRARTEFSISKMVDSYINLVSEYTT